MSKSVAKLFLKNLGRRAGLEISVRRKRGQETIPGYVSDEFRTLYQKYCHRSMVPWSGLYTSFKAARYVAEAGIPGDLVECGVWKGGCSAIMAEALRAHGAGDRSIYLYDTFEGMTQPTAQDAHFSGAHNAIKKFNRLKRDGSVGSDWSRGAIDEVKESMAMSGYNTDLIHYIKGPVEETLVSNPLPDTISVLRLDTDWYESTKVEMEQLFPRLQKGGVFLVDDYGAWKGAYEAVNEYFEAHNIQMFLQTDASFGGAAGIKM